MLITIGSVTAATRLARILERETGCPVSVVHTPSSINKGGCSYSVRLKDELSERARRIIREYNVPVKKFYSESERNGKHVYHDIS